MKVALYIANINIKGGGIYTYANAILKLLINEKYISKIILLFSADQFEYVNKLKTEYSKILPIKINIEGNIFKKTLLNISKLLWINRIISKNKLPVFLDKLSQLLNPYYHLFNKLEVDLIHFPVPVSPVYGINKPIIVTIHDLQDLHYPEFFSPEHRIERSIHLYRAARLADRIIVSFDHVKKDIINFFKVRENKISVVPIPLSRYWQYNSNLNIKPDKKILNKFKIEGDYLLYPAVTWPHKNHITLFKAIKELKNQGIHIQLICTGALNSYYHNLIVEINNFQLHDNVKFLGVVTEEDLYSLYRFAKIIVIPSLYEAGSGPLIEAIWLGLPVICSNVTSLPETIGDKRYLFDPLNSVKLAEIILKMLNDKKFYEENLKNSLIQRKKFEDIEINNIMTYIYKNLIDQKRNLTL